MTIHDSLSAVMKRIDTAKQRAGRNDEVKLCAVTKYSDVDDINKAIECGVGIIGESRVQDALNKLPYIKPVEKHFIGHLQTNKVRYVMANFDMIQSVDSIKLAKEINKRGKIDVLLQVNISGEEKKYGVQPEEAASFYDDVSKYENLRIAGLMGIAPRIEPQLTREYFQKLKKINDELKLPDISMGMTNDFEIAIEEGATIVRIGSAIFRN